MARQIGHIFITGTIHDVTYYKMFGTYYARMKSSLSRDKVLTSPKFVLTRMHANQLAEASKIASQLYKEVPKEKRYMQLFRSLVGKAKVLLAEGKEKETVMRILMNELFPKPKCKAPKLIIKKRPVERAYITERGRLIWRELKHGDDLIKEINVDFIPFDKLCEIVTPREDDPLLYEGYELIEKQIDTINSIRSKTINPDFDRYDYMLVCTGIYDWEKN